MVPIVRYPKFIIQALKRERDPKKYIQDVTTFLWREALAAEEVLKVPVPYMCFSTYRYLGTLQIGRKLGLHIRIHFLCIHSVMRMDSDLAFSNEHGS